MVKNENNYPLIMSDRHLMLENYIMHIINDHFLYMLICIMTNIYWNLKVNLLLALFDRFTEK